MTAFALIKQVTRMPWPQVEKIATRQLRLNELAYWHYMVTSEDLKNEEIFHDETDLHAVPKVDFHLHLGAIMTSPQLIKFLRELCDEHGDDVIDGKTVCKVICLAGSQPGKSADDDLRTQSTQTMLQDFVEFNQAFLPVRRAANKL